RKQNKTNKNKKQKTHRLTCCSTSYCATTADTWPCRRETTAPFRHSPRRALIATAAGAQRGVIMPERTNMNHRGRIHECSKNKRSTYIVPVACDGQRHRLDRRPTRRRNPARRADAEARRAHERERGQHEQHADAEPRRLRMLQERDGESDERCVCV